MSESSFILLASTSTGEDRSLSPVKRAKVEFISAVELHAINIDSLCNCCYREPKIVYQTVSLHLVIPLLNRKQNLNSFAKNVILKCRIKIYCLQFILELSTMYIHLDRQEVRISSPPDLPG